MIVEASVTGLVRTLLIIIGALVILRFFGQLLNAKKNMEHERDLNKRQRKFDEEKLKKKRNLGKTKVLKDSHSDSVEDVDFEEVD